mmetsp:Transcript_28838/g.71167  ORF Transcript_28838/g.71167 Transcript_28838/m.71167 type:complete len:273 (+) Transcript_28838:281-1099(+)
MFAKISTCCCCCGGCGGGGADEKSPNKSTAAAAASAKRPTAGAAAANVHAPGNPALPGGGASGDAVESGRGDDITPDAATLIFGTKLPGPLPPLLPAPPPAPRGFHTLSSSKSPPLSLLLPKLAKLGWLLPPPPPPLVAPPPPPRVDKNLSGAESYADLDELLLLLDTPSKEENEDDGALKEPLRTSSADIPLYLPRLEMALSRTSAIFSGSLSSVTRVVDFCRTLMPWSRPLGSLNWNSCRRLISPRLERSSRTTSSAPCAMRNSMIVSAL